MKPSQPGTETPIDAEVDRTITEARQWLEDQQAEDGHWVFELEADCTIPAEYIMLNHYLDEINDNVEKNWQPIYGQNKANMAAGRYSMTVILISALLSKLIMP